jgi:hypothetical protein
MHGARLGGLDEPDGRNAFAWECQTVPVGKLPLPRVFKDAVEAVQAATQHLQAANTKQGQIIALLREVESERSRLSPEERAARHREIHELREQVRREKDAASHPMDELKTRYPRWIK